MSLILTGAVAGALVAAAPQTTPQAPPSQPAARLQQAEPPASASPWQEDNEDQREPGKSPAEVIADALGEQAHREPGWRDPHGFARPSPDRDFPVLPMAQPARR